MRGRPGWTGAYGWFPSLHGCLVLLLLFLLLILAPQGAAQDEDVGQQEPHIDESLGTEVAVRTVGFIAASVAAGIPIFYLALPNTDAFRARQRPLFIWSAGAGAVATLASALLLVLIAVFEGIGFRDTIRHEDGSMVAVRTVAFLLFAISAAAVAWHAPRGRVATGALAALGFIGLVAVTLTGHAAAEPVHRTVAIAANFVHLSGVAFWIGGLFLLGVLIVGQTDHETLYESIRRFSPLAITAVAVIILSGSTSSILRLTEWGDLLHTLYGRALLLKILLIVPLMGFGALNGFVLQPRLKHHESHKAARHLRISILAETGLMIIVFVAASTLAAVEPPSSVPEGVEFDLP